MYEGKSVQNVGENWQERLKLSKGNEGTLLQAQLEQHQNRHAWMAALIFVTAKHLIGFFVP